MTPAEYKSTEGTRILAAMGAFAALPGAGLVSGTEQGAALFSSALVFLAASYGFWVLTDAIYYLSVRAKERGEADHWNPLLAPAGYRFQSAMIVYAVASILLSLGGFACEHTAIALPVSPEAAFVGVAFSAAWVFAHFMIENSARNRLGRAVRSGRGD